MSKIILNDLPDYVVETLQLRASQHGCSVADEIRKILENATRPVKNLKIGSELAAFGLLINTDFEPVRDPAPIRQVSFD
jgi:plasmid stability protein